MRAWQRRRARCRKCEKRCWQAAGSVLGGGGMRERRTRLYPISAVDRIIRAVDGEATSSHLHHARKIVPLPPIDRSVNGSAGKIMMDRRNFLGGAAALGAVAGLGPGAHAADEWPLRQVTIIVPFT